MAKLKGWRELPIGGLIVDAGNAMEYKTGSWRVMRPVYTREKCIDCMLCWLICPDMSIIQKDGKMIGIVMDFYDRAVGFVKKKVALSQILKEDIVETMMRMKEMIGNDELEKFEDVRKMIDSHFEELERIYGS